MQKLGIQLLPPSHFTLPSSATKQTSERPSPKSQLRSGGSPTHCSPQREREGLNSPSSHSGAEYSTATSSSSSRARNGSTTTKSDLHRYSHVNAHANARVNVEGAPTTADGHFHDSGLPASLQDPEPCDRERRFRWKRGEDEGEWSRKEGGTSEHYTAEHVIHGMRTSRGTTLATPNVHQARGRPARATLGSKEGTCSETEGDAVPAGQYWDNTEEIVARSLARCQKIDKSLEFYAPLRKKWSDSSSASTSPTSQNSSTSSPSGTERGDEKKIGFAAGNNNSAAPPTIANCTASAAAPKKQQNPAERELSRPLHHCSTTSNSSTAPKLNGEPDKPCKRQTPTYSKPPTRIALNDLSSVPQGHMRSSKPRNGGCVGQQQRPPTLTLVCPPRGQVVVPAQETGSGNALRVPTPIDTSSWANERVTPRQKVYSLTHINCPPLPGLSESERDELCPSLNPPQFDQEREEDEEDINDFDSVQQDSDTESVEPLTGAFAEAVLTGSYTPLSPLSTIASTEQLGVDTRPILSRQNSSDSDGVVREKTPPVSTTRNDTLLARVLQAEEESRAGVSLTRKLANKPLLSMFMFMRKYAG